MKRTLLLIFALICFGIIIYSFLFIYKPKGTGNTVQEAIIKSGRTPMKIISEDKVNGGVVVIFTKNSLDLRKAELACGFVKKTIWGWKWVIGGEHGSIENICYKQGFSYQYFPKSKGTPFPLYFGAITNPDITQVKLIESGNKVEAKANIVSKSNVRVWYIYTNEVEGSNLDIVAFSADDKELGKFTYGKGVLSNGLSD